MFEVITGHHEDGRHCGQDWRAGELQKIPKLAGPKTKAMMGLESTGVK